MIKRSEFYAFFIVAIVLMTATVSFAVSYQPVINYDLIKIGEYSPSGSVSSYTINSIPSEYKVLKLYINATTTESAGTAPKNLYCRFNNDATQNYFFAEMASSPASPSFTYYSLYIGLLGAYANAASSNIEMTINNSIANCIKTVFWSQFSIYNNGSWVMTRLYSFGAYNNTTAINSITIICDSNFSSTSKFILYGLK